MEEYDFGINWSVKAEDELFVKSLMRFCQRHGLSFFWVSDENVRNVLGRMERNELKIKFLLDTEATYNKEKDSYARVCYAVKDSGGIVVNDPDRARLAVDKSAAHYELASAGITTPYSVVIRNWEPKYFKLSEEEKKNLGEPFVIKPASGYSRRGVIQDARGSIREIAQARNFDKGDNFLLQEKIKPIYINGRRAWFRVFRIFNRIVPCWWDDQTSWYEQIKYEEFRRYRIQALVRITAKIAQATKMLWFSTEIAIDKKEKKERFVVVDYVNDQCDMTPQSQEKIGVPDEVVKYTAWRLIDSASKIIKGEGVEKKYGIWLAEKKLIFLQGLI